MKRPVSYSREELEKIPTKKLMDLKNKWTLFLKQRDETEFGDSKFLQKEAKNQIILIRDIINGRLEENGE